MTIAPTREEHPVTNPFEEEADAAKEALDLDGEGFDAAKRSGGDVELKKSGGDVEFSGGDVESGGDGEEGSDSGGDVETEPGGDGS
jgi:hypothetical protein